MNTRSERFDFTADDARAGFRLHRCEVLNWGTFDKAVWVMPLDGDNALLTGDIGSGKSTLVDALTTLLVRADRIVYNKAAGAETKERSLVSYIRGHYKSEKDDLALGAKAVALRERQTYSVLLAYFHNEGYGQGITIAQVFALLDGQSQPERMYVVAEGDLTIRQDFADFGSDLKDLRKRLRRDPRVQIFDSFSQYETAFRRLFGIQNPQALNLFYQTVSMKSVGNLTAFIREHMLEAPPVQEQIDRLCNDFDNLNAAYEAVQKARRQLEVLTPLVADCDRHEAEVATMEELRGSREALEPFVAGLRVELLDARIRTKEAEVARLTERAAALARELEALRQRETDLRRSIDDQGGRRLEDIRREIEQLAKERQRLQAMTEVFERDCAVLGLDAPESEAAFEAMRRDAVAAQAALQGEETGLRQERVDLGISFQQARDQGRALEQELASLRARRSNIPLPSIELRARMCEALGLLPEDVPFAGEHLRVADTERDWEAAIERYLHNFGVSLLVPERLYAQVARYVDRTHLKGRLVYFRVREEAARPQWPDDARSLVHKLQVKQDSPFAPWLEAELCRRDLVCTDNLEEFARQPRAMTPQGQIKSGGARHEKDDRRPLGDRAQYVLGWTNEDKIRALSGQLDALVGRLTELSRAIERCEERSRALSSRRSALEGMLRVERFADMDWRPVAARIAELEAERRRLSDESDVLRLLKEELDRTLAVISETQVKSDELREGRGKESSRLEGYQEQRREAETTAACDQFLKERFFPPLSAMQAEVLGDRAMSVENSRGLEREWRETLQRRIDAVDKRIKALYERVIPRMEQFKQAFPEASREMDASLEAADDFRRLRDTLLADDLPRHEATFKTMLNENAINGMVLFQNELDKQQQDIREKIAVINQSLRAIAYNPGTYIELGSDATQDPQVRDFRRDLRACLEDTLTVSADELYAERKFLQVKALIDRFNGRKDASEADRRWRELVTDVRNWFVFSASERWQADHTVKEFYSDSAGKSGGQKEKLAYTILASALAYQFGLEWGAVRSRSFRFVMIDEAFGRGSDESARYGLELFRSLNLQLLIVTPFQKINVIEDYVRTVHVVHNEGGRQSKVMTLSVEDYRARKALYGALAGELAP